MSHPLRLTLRTLLAYLDDTLSPTDARAMGLKAAENATAQDLIERIRRVTRRRGLATPTSGPDGSPSDPNTVAEYLSDELSGERLTGFEHACIENDVHLAEVAGCHQILTMVLSEPVRVPPTARKRMYLLVKGRESIPNRQLGDIVPVGGVLPEEEKAVAGGDPIDPSFLLGMTGYSQNGSVGRRAVMIGTAVAVSAALVFAVWMAVPASIPNPTDSTRTVALAPVPTTPATKPETLTPTTKPAVTPTPESAPVPKPVPEDPKKDPEAPKPPMPPVVPVEPKKDPKNPPPELVPVPVPPKPDLQVAGRFERTVPNPILLRKVPELDAWNRVTVDDAAIQTTRRILCLPGYRATVRLDSELKVELWGNLPELLAAPLLASSTTFSAPHDGFDSDVTLHAGRIYLSTKKPTGADVRVRVADQVWDVKLANDKTEIAVEVTYTLSRGAIVEPSRVAGSVAVLAGSASLKSGFKTIPQISPGEAVFWDSKGKGLDGPKKPDANAGPAATSYYSRFPLSQDADQTKRTLAVLEELSKRLTDASRLKVIFAEMMQESNGAPTPTELARIRLAVMDQAAVGDLSGLVDAISDANRPYVREAAVAALQSTLASEPTASEPFRQQLIDKARLTAEQADTAIRLLHGFTDMERKDPQILDKLVDSLAAGAVCVRELAYMNLMTEIDPEARMTPMLARFDAGGREEVREASVKAWRRRIDELKKKLAAPPPE